jgi:WD40 repeat protein/serine/threonine protein kinase
MNDCPTTRQMTDFLLGKLPSGEFEAFAAHLDMCADCQVLCEACERDADALVSELQQVGIVRGDGDASFDREPQLQWAMEEIRALGADRDEQPFVASVESADGTGGDGGNPPDVAVGRPFPEVHRGRSGRPCAVGDTIGAYCLLERIARGGMGTVYKALHRQLEKVVAIKLLPSERWNSPNARRRFDREMKAVGKFDHPHIVRAFDAGQADGLLFLVMEYVDGIDLSRLVRRIGPLPAADACELVRQAAIGLQHVHEHGLVHRDIKPSNLMLARDGVLKVLDLGVARLESELFTPDDPASDATCMGRLEQTLADLTSTGQFLGTSDYMAPEQWENTRQVDIRSDLYSLGCTLHHLLTGRAPFDRLEYNTAWKKMKAHAEVAPPPLQEERPDIHPALAALVARLMAKLPGARFTAPAEVAEALQPLAVGHDLPALIVAADAGRPIRQAPGDPCAPPGRTGLVFPSPPSPAVASNPGSTVALVNVLKNAYQYLIPIWNADGISGLFVGIVRDSKRRRFAIGMIVCLIVLAIFGADRHRWRTSQEIDRSRQVVSASSAPQTQPADQGIQPLPTQRNSAGEATLSEAAPAPSPGEAVEPWQMALPVPRRNIWAVAWSPDDRYLALAEGDSVRIIDAVTLQPVSTCRGHAGVVTSVVWNRAGTRLASASADRTVRIWRTDGTCESILSGHDDFVVTLDWSPNDRWIASGSADATVRLWRNDGDSSSRVLVSAQERSGSMEQFVVSVAWSPDGRQLASAGNDCRIRLWDADGNPGAVLSGHRASVTAVAWSPDGGRIASGSADNTVRIWRTAETSEAAVTLTGHEQPVTAVACSPDGRWIASSSYDGTIRLWNGEIPGPVLRPMGGTVHAVGWKADGSRLAAGLQDGTVWFWDVASEKPQLTMVLAGRGAQIKLAPADRLRSIVPGGEGGQAMYFVKQPDGGVSVLRQSEFYEFVSQQNERNL